MTSIANFAPGLGKVAEGSLYPHQADGVAFMLSKKRVILADDMGLGKTRQAIVAMEVGAPEGRVLVVCPASLKLNWKREIQLVDPDASIEVLGVDKDATEKSAVGDCQLRHPSQARGTTARRPVGRCNPGRSPTSSRMRAREPIIV